jgi:alpha-tubulin suppressor-like RCC1 family protein
MIMKINNKYLPSVVFFGALLVCMPAYSESLTAGEDHTCLLKSNGAAYCWGDNSVGQLGNGSTEPSMVPVAVSGNLRFDSISGSWDHTCGVTREGNAYCWGRGRYGRLGNGMSEHSTVPVAVSGGLTFESVSAGLAHTCGVTTDGSAFCWGLNEDGILGNNSVETSAIPVAVAGALSFGSIRAGSATTCGITKIGDAYCWGSGDFGRLLGQGPNDRGNKMSPGLVAGDFKFKPDSLSVGLDHACAISTDEKAVCWGRGRYGKLGIGRGDGLGVIDNLMTPREINGNISFALITTGVFQTCGIASDNASYCWGRNGSGQLGDGTTVMRVEPAVISTDQTFTAITIGNDHACGVAVNKDIYCWGDGNAGKLGNLTSDNRLTPTKVAAN